MEQVTPRSESYGKHGAPRPQGRPQSASFGRHGRPADSSEAQATQVMRPVPAEDRPAAASQATQRIQGDAPLRDPFEPRDDFLELDALETGAPAVPRHGQGTASERDPFEPSDFFPADDPLQARDPFEPSSSYGRGSRSGETQVMSRISRRPSAGGAHAARAAAGSWQGDAAVEGRDFLWEAPRKRGRRWPKVVIGFVVVLVAALLALWLYVSNALDSALERGETHPADSALTPAAFGQPFYMLLLGCDSRDAENPDGYQQTDVMMLARVDMANRQVTLVSIPRDTPAVMDDGSVVKINGAYNYGGPAGSVKAVSELTGVPISHYALVHFSEFQEIVDELGGVEFDVPVRMSYRDALTGEPLALEPGAQVLDGQQAQLLVRARREYGGNQDAARQQTIRDFMGAIAKTLLSQPLPTMKDSVVSIADNVSTDIRSIDLLGMGLGYGVGSGDLTMYQCSGPNEGGLDPARDDLWFCYDNPQGWADLMAVVDAGENPEGMDFNGTAIIH